MWQVRDRERLQLLLPRREFLDSSTLFAGLLDFHGLLGCLRFFQLLLLLISALEAQSHEGDGELPRVPLPWKASGARPLVPVALVEHVPLRLTVHCWAGNAAAVSAGVPRLCLVLLMRWSKLGMLLHSRWRQRRLCPSFPALFRLERVVWCLFGLSLELRASLAVSGVLFGRLFRQSVGRNGESFGSRSLSIAGGSFALGR